MLLLFCAVLYLAYGVFHALELYRSSSRQEQAEYDASMKRFCFVFWTLFWLPIGLYLWGRNFLRGEM